MPHFYLNLRSDTEEVLDLEGIELASADDAAPSALAAARDIMAGDIRQGIVDLRFRIDVENDAGQVVETLSFSDAVTFMSANAEDALAA